MYPSPSHGRSKWTKVGALAGPGSSACCFNSSAAAEDAAEELPEPAQAESEEADDVQTITVEGNIYKAAATFEDLHLSPSLLQGLYTEMKFQRPSQIQAKTLPLIFQPPYQSLIAQVSPALFITCSCD